MNNRYICRGKRKDNGEWVTGHYVFQRKCSGVFGQMISELDFDRHLIIDLRGNSHEVIPETVGQCTGLKDKNGKWIFAGDVVVSTSDRRLSDRPRLITIDFERGCNYCAAKRKPVVIGNIHDNPELLEADRWKKEVTKMKEEIE